MLLPVCAELGHAAIKPFPERALEIASGVISRRRCYDRGTKIAETELVEVGHRGLGTVHPDSCFDRRLQPLGELEDRITGDRWSPFRFRSLLFLCDCFAHRRQPT